MGFGLGASGAFAHVAAYLEAGRVWAQWIVLEVAGILVGGLLGAWSAGRLQWRLEKGSRIGWGRRLLFAFVGGATVGFASRVAQGCTSGVALSGGAVLSPGAWAFTLAFMGGGFATAWIVRRAWR